MPFNAIDLFSGCGGMTEGLLAAGFNVVAAVEIDKYASSVYKANHTQNNISVFEEDIRQMDPLLIQELLGDEPLHLLSGCPPCQGFSSLRRKNKKRSQKDSRNNLIMEYVRFVEVLHPLTIMLENVPGLENYTLFKKAISRLRALGYILHYRVVDVSVYGVPQRRKRLVLIGSIIGDIDIPQGDNTMKTVREYIGDLEPAEETTDPAHMRYMRHSEKMLERIRLTPHDGGSRRDWPEEYTLTCHTKENVGFHDVYGRLRWDAVSSTITGGCLNPSKGRFLHPEADRCITAREAAMLQTFRRDYRFPENISLTNIALMIGNALPPLFCQQQAQHISELLYQYGYR